MNLIKNTGDTTPATFGDLCEALADRELASTVEDGYYVLRRGDLRRFVQPDPGVKDATIPTMLAMIMREPVSMAS